MSFLRAGSVLRPAILAVAACGIAASSSACRPTASLQGKVAVSDAGTLSGSTTVPMTLVSLRPVVELTLVRPDGGRRRVLAWVNMGAPAPVLSEGLYRELGIGQGHALAFRLGDFAITVAADAVTDGPGELDGRDLFSLLFAPSVVEMVLPASVLRRFRVVLDPAAATLTLARPGVLKPAGLPVPIRVNDEAGIVAVEAGVAGSRVPLVLDVGAPYTWLRGGTVAGWLRANPEWHRAAGAVGRSNIAMADLGLERNGTVVRIPDLAIGDLVLHEVGALGTGPLFGRPAEAVIGEVFWDAWQARAGVTAAGWLGGNVLGDYRLTIDYPAGMSYWQRQRPADAHDLDGAGLTLVRAGDGYDVGAVADRAASADIRPGDHLLAVDGTCVQGMPPDRVLATLAGRPGERHRLDVSRAGELLAIEVTSMRF